MKTTIAIKDIELNRGIQVRDDYNLVTIEDYTAVYQQALEDGVEPPFPPVEIVRINDDGLILTNGFHRVLAATRTGIEKISADVVDGNIDLARKKALSANATNGLQRTNADKRKAVMMALDFFPEKSNREIAEICGVTHPFVGNVRKEMFPPEPEPEPEEKPAQKVKDSKDLIRKVDPKIDAKYQICPVCDNLVYCITKDFKHRVGCIDENCKLSYRTFPPKETQEEALDNWMYVYDDYVARHTDDSDSGDNNSTSGTSETTETKTASAPSEAINYDYAAINNLEPIVIKAYVAADKSGRTYIYNERPTQNRNKDWVGSLIIIDNDIDITIPHSAGIVPCSITITFPRNEYEHIGEEI